MTTVEGPEPSQVAAVPGPPGLPFSQIGFIDVYSMLMS